jgi:hypothetical protein
LLVGRPTPFTPARGGKEAREECVEGGKVVARLHQGGAQAQAQALPIVQAHLTDAVYGIEAFGDRDAHPVGTQQADKSE